MNITSYKKSRYEKNRLFSRGKNKPNSKPIQSQSNPIQSQYKPKTNPIKPNLLALFLLVLFIFFNISCSKTPANDNNQSNQQAPDPNDTKTDQPEDKHPAFGERIEQRAKMVADQIKSRGISDPNVLKAMQTVPRHSFVQHTNENFSKSNLKRAYADHPLPIGFSQTISQPYIVAFMTEALMLQSDYKVLEIGTGSGYQAAVCAEIAREVYTIEIVEGLADRSGKLLKELGCKNVFVKAGDGFFGWPEKAPFDAIIGTAAAERIPEPLIEQLKPNGRMIIPYESASGFQYLVLITKDEKGELQKKNVLPVRFVPMTGEVQKK